MNLLVPCVFTAYWSAFCSSLDNSLLKDLSAKKGENARAMSVESLSVAVLFFMWAISCSTTASSSLRDSSSCRPMERNIAGKKEVNENANGFGESMLNVFGGELILSSSALLHTSLFRRRSFADVVFLDLRYNAGIITRPRTNEATSAARIGVRSFPSIPIPPQVITAFWQAIVYVKSAKGKNRNAKWP